MDFEKLGAFYLGKEYDLDAETRRERLILYDARDLTTHAVVLGMTGSGKTGLCICLLEEAAIDRVPAIIIDPKGDITNLLLQFPDLRPADFRPWINEGDALRKGLTPDQFATQQAQLWEKGLGEWGQDGNRIRTLGDTADFRIYTPGSESGRPISVLHSLDSPGLDWAVHGEILRERIEATVSAILGLLNIDADPIKSREHILLSNLLEQCWRQNAGLDLAQLIQLIQKPPFSRLGVLELETFYPASDRFQLAMRLNSLLASPSFAGWLHGDAMDVAHFLAAADGRTRHSIFYLAHLGDAERIFFVTLLLNQIIGWMRGQPGTTSLRALVYMDEIFGYFPPVASPPSKKPMLTLLKQARAFGVGMVLATQNPVDLDYKGLSNTGTWFIGRMQAERDKERVIEGLLGASGQAGLDRKSLSNIISRLKSRIFLLHNVHESEPVVFQTRWAMSYLRGPLTRDQIQRLQKPAPATGPSSPPSVPGPAAVTPPARAAHPQDGLSANPPVLPEGITQVFLRPEAGASGGSPNGGGLVYRPAVLGFGTVHYFDRKSGVDVQRDFACLWRGFQPGADFWRDSEEWSGRHPFGDTEPEAGARFEELPGFVARPREFSRLARELEEFMVRNSRLDVPHSPALKLYSGPDEPERDFHVRLNQAIREHRDAEIDRLTEQFRRRIDPLADRIRAAEVALEHQKSTEKSRQTEFLVSVGESLLGMFMGRRSYRTASSSVSRYRQKSAAGQAVEKSEVRIETLRQDLATVEEELRRKVDELTARWERAGKELETVSIRPRRTDVHVQGVWLAWLA
jgi:hypothetical protein